MDLDRLPPRTLVLLALAGGLSFQLIVGGAYLAAFLDPLRADDGVPLLVANEDEGDLGGALVEALLQQGGPARWREATRGEVAHALREKHAFGALVLPANFTAALRSYGSEAPAPARVERWTNPGASTSGALIAERATDLAIAAVEERAREEALAASAPPVPVIPGTVTLAQARWLADPVLVESRVANAVPANGANGLAPAYLAMAAWLGGYLGSVALERFRPLTRLRPLARSAIVAGAAVAQGALAALACVLLGLDAPDALLLAGVLALGTWMAYCVVSLLMDVFGVPGVVPAIAVMAVGLPASGAVYPEALLPGFFRALHPWDPFTWLVEALRTALYATGAGDLPLNAAKLAGLSVVLTLASLGLGVVRGRRVAETRV